VTKTLASRFACLLVFGVSASPRAESLTIAAADLKFAMAEVVGQFRADAGTNAAMDRLGTDLSAWPQTRCRCRMQACPPG
jgi:hypothetical protein